MFPYLRSLAIEIPILYFIILEEFPQKHEGSIKTKMVFQTVHHLHALDELQIVLISIPCYRHSSMMDHNN